MIFRSNLGGNMLRKNKLDSKKNALVYILVFQFLALIAALTWFCLFRPDHLMHSDMSAEVILSKLLADENRLISPNWYYSTEIRILYSQIIMVPLFKVFSNYQTVKYCSVFIFYILLSISTLFLSNKLKISKTLAFIPLILLFTPLSNEYFDMMLIGCFYTSQMICTFIVLGQLLKNQDDEKRLVMNHILMFLFAVLLGLTGVRFLVSLYVPICIALGVILLGKIPHKVGLKKLLSSQEAKGIYGLLGGGVGFLINKFYLAKAYSFDTTSEVTFVPLDELMNRFLISLKTMIEFMGYHEAKVLSLQGIVNCGKLFACACFILMVLFLYKKRNTLLSDFQRLYLYFFLALFFMNWFFFVFSQVLQQYRYWIPIYATGVFLIPIFIQTVDFKSCIQKWAIIGLVIFVASGSLYGELYLASKNNDCAKRYAYLEFLEKNEYTFGYATFWNASVTEYLSNGTLQVGNLGGKDGKAAPYEWLTPKYYYQDGYHEGKTFLLLARTEAVGMDNGDFTVMPDAVKVYEDEYYAVYEGQGMYLFSK